jgi:hypothetical protein
VKALMRKIERLREELIIAYRNSELCACARSHLSGNFCVTLYG